MIKLNLHVLDFHEDTKGKAFDANTKININLKQLNGNIELLPESEDDERIQDMSELKYLRTVYEILYENSKLIGFDYPLIESDLSFAFNTKDKIYIPINNYFVKLTN